MSRVSLLDRLLFTVPAYEYMPNNVVTVCIYIAMCIMTGAIGLELTHVCSCQVLISTHAHQIYAAKRGYFSLSDVVSVASVQCTNHIPSLKDYKAICSLPAAANPPSSMHHDMPCDLLQSLYIPMHLVSSFFYAIPISMYLS